MAQSPVVPLSLPDTGREPILAVRSRIRAGITIAASPLMTNIPALVLSLFLATAVPLPAAADDSAAIRAVLDAYTGSVSSGDRAAFEALLLDPAIPFLGLSDGKLAAKHGASAGAIAQYAGFKKSVFDSGRQLTQRFFDVKIAHEGDLAQVSLQFETRVVGQAGGSRGWKTLELLRVAGQWKIASEFYTVYPL